MAHSFLHRLLYDPYLSSKSKPERKSLYAIVETPFGPAGSTGPGPAESNIATDNAVRISAGRDAMNLI